MAPSEVSGRKAGPAVERAAFTIAEFCRAHRISESFYYKIRNKGLGPRESRTGGKVTITNEAAAEWRVSREVVETA
jgi:hypothetical protein